MIKKTSFFLFQSLTSCTDILSKWLVPARKKIEMMKLKNINWQFEEAVSSKEKFKTIPPMSGLEIDGLLQNISSQNDTCALMVIREPFSDIFIQKDESRLIESFSDSNLIVDDEIGDCNIARIEDISYLYLENVYKKDNSKNLEELKSIALTTPLGYTEGEIIMIQKLTVRQSETNFWFKLRAGRVTASNFKEVVKTSKTKPALSLIKKICYPLNHIFTTKATKYGVENEPIARDAYKKLMEKNHTNFKIETCGLFISNNYPECGASPDGICSCDCCGQYILEIKCPFNINKDGIEFYSQKNYEIAFENNQYKLKSTSKWYYQVQMQLYVTNTNFCHFFVWSPKNVFMEKIYKDDALWRIAYPIAQKYFREFLVPEIIGTYFTQQRISYWN